MTNQQIYDQIGAFQNSFNEHRMPKLANNTIYSL